MFKPNDIASFTSRLCLTHWCAPLSVVFCMLVPPADSRYRSLSIGMAIYDITSEFAEISIAAQAVWAKTLTDSRPLGRVSSWPPSTVTACYGRLGRPVWKRMAALNSARQMLRIGGKQRRFRRKNVSLHPLSSLASSLGRRKKPHLTATWLPGQTCRVCTHEYCNHAVEA